MIFPLLSIIINYSKVKVTLCQHAHRLLSFITFFSISLTYGSAFGQINVFPYVVHAQHLTFHRRPKLDYGILICNFVYLLFPNVCSN